MAYDGLELAIATSLKVQDLELLESFEEDTDEFDDHRECLLFPDLSSLLSLRCPLL